MKNEIIIYHSDELSTKLQVRLEDESVWLTQSQIVELFDSSKANVSEHIKNIYDTSELNKESTVRNFRTVQLEGKRSVTRDILHYNLDVIISIGYRINSKRGTQFRIWASKVLKDYMLKGYAINHRVDKIENDLGIVQKELGEIKLNLNKSLSADFGVFFDGEVYDAYVFVTEVIRLAEKSIILIDNYVDDTVLTMLSKREKNIPATIYTSKITKQLSLDLQKHNSQYPAIEIKLFKESHDRFLIVDNKNVYHIGASLKDLGKKWFAFSKINIDPILLLDKLD